MIYYSHKTVVVLVTVLMNMLPAVWLVLIVDLVDKYAVVICVWC